MIFILQCLGSVINCEKSHLVPTQTLEYLGMLIASVTMTLSLPERKLIAIIQKCQCLLAKTVVIGMLTPLHYRRLQMTQIGTLLEYYSYNSLITLPKPCREELNWGPSQCETMQWKVSSKHHSRSDSNIGCIQGSLGCIVWQIQHQRVLEQGRERNSHQYLRTGSR